MFWLKEDYNFLRLFFRENTKYFDVFVQPFIRIRFYGLILFLCIQITCVSQFLLSHNTISSKFNWKYLEKKSDIKILLLTSNANRKNVRTIPEIFEKSYFAAEFSILRVLLRFLDLKKNALATWDVKIDLSRGWCVE